VSDPTRGVLYADTSALVKLVVREAETEALDRTIVEWDRIATSEIAAIELPAPRHAHAPTDAATSPTDASSSNSSPPSAWSP
jgi:hypothetical protein